MSLKLQCVDSSIPIFEYQTSMVHTFSLQDSTTRFAVSCTLNRNNPCMYVVV